MISSIRTGWIVCLLAMVQPCVAGMLDGPRVARDTQWAVHIDLRGFRESQVGSFLNEQVLAKAMEKIANDLREHLGFQMDWQGLQSITVYGRDYGQGGTEADGVAVIHWSEALHRRFGAWVRDHAGKKGVLGTPGVELETVGDNLYSLDGQMFLLFQSGHRLILAKARNQVEMAQAVLEVAGKGIGLEKRFGGYPPLPKTVVFTAMAEGFNQGAKIPPEAQVLQNAAGLRLAVGENEDEVVAQVALKAADGETARQIQLVIQGMFALGMLHLKDPDVGALLRETKVRVEGNLVMLDLKVGVGKVLKVLKHIQP